MEVAVEKPMEAVTEAEEKAAESRRSVKVHNLWVRNWGLMLYSTLSPGQLKVTPSSGLWASFSHTNT